MLMHMFLWVLSFTRAHQPTIGSKYFSAFTKAGQVIHPVVRPSGVLSVAGDLKSRFLQMAWKYEKLLQGLVLYSVVHELCVIYGIGDTAQGSDVCLECRHRMTTWIAMATPK
jgi:hypothetical protein